MTCLFHTWFLDVIIIFLLFFISVFFIILLFLYFFFFLSSLVLISLPPPPHCPHLHTNAKFPSSTDITYSANPSSYFPPPTAPDHASVFLCCMMQMPSDTRDCTLLCVELPEQFMRLLLHLLPVTVLWGLRFIYLFHLVPSFCSLWLYSHPSHLCCS